MAGAATIAELAGRISSIGILMLFVRSRFVIACVTAGAVRLKGGELPVYDFGIVLMTSGTQKVAAVILRLIRQAGMAVICRRPGNRAVAQAAVLRRIEVTRVLTGRDRAVVAGRTGSKYLIVVHRGDRLPDSRVVAVFANIGRLHVQRAFTGSFGAVVAAEAVVHDVDVVKIRGNPRDSGVTVVAVVTARDVGRMFASRRHAVMTRAAGAHYLGVVDGEHRLPHIARVTVFANGTCLNV